MADDQSVFLNVPFDRQYQPLFQAIVFAVFDCGFRARCALEVDDGSQVRLDKLCGLIRECRYGIHDISRTELDRRLPRFNMPLELGLFLGAKRFGSGSQRLKNCLILDREPYRFQRFCSDIAGQDIRAHRNRTDLAVSMVRNWLNGAMSHRGILIPGPVAILDRYARFQSDLPRACQLSNLSRPRITFVDYTMLLARWLKDHPW